MSEYKSRVAVKPFTVILVGGNIVIDGVLHTPEVVENVMQSGDVPHTAVSPHEVTLSICAPALRKRKNRAVAVASNERRRRTICLYFKIFERKI